MQHPSVQSVMQPDTPGRRIGERIALLLSHAKLMRDIPVQTKQESDSKWQ